ncbi:hypothetical protein [Paramaledivibacter caminithermalis]|jgi:hypothetical protein|uniref:Transglutaminase-like superfamily protein n=1 Tax=Paramaledivibacter caminithermalis (strain DSM 15212 / CIP 107654 / DViRD3) TaxID=1121301 RepID=A0A1M6U6M9_PARC5|nr:hypothetical protein [Paramaledivibacter caminithermalis]SHK64820.1 hypothetical protein SAMN02745912_03883 [Paramaledivibacter caminithermalis DSM 15212]
MKKVLIFTLITVLLVGSFQNSYAISNKNKSKLEKVHGKSISIKNVNQKLGINTKLAKKSVPQIFYDYFTEFEKEENLGTAVVKGHLEIEGNRYDFKTEGEVEKKQLKSGELIEGALKGNIVIEGDEYKLLIGFAKKNKKVCLSMNIYNESDSMVMIFGKPIISENDMKEIKEKKSKETKKKNSNMYNFTSIKNEKMCKLKSVTRIFEYIKSESAYMKNSTIDDERGVKVKLYQEENNGELLLLKLRSYAEDIEEALGNYDPFSKSVELYEVKAGFKFSKGKCDGVHPSEDDDGSSVDVFNILYDVLNCFGIPTNTLAAAINGSKGYLNVYSSTLTPYLKTRAGSNLELDFDDEYVPFFVIGIDGNQGKVAGKFYAEMEYKEKYYIPMDGYVYNYYESKKAEDDFSLDVTD